MLYPIPLPNFLLQINQFAFFPANLNEALLLYYKTLQAFNYSLILLPLILTTLTLTIAIHLVLVDHTPLHPLAMLKHRVP